MSQTAAFDLLHDGVRRQLWKMGWGSLRQLQVDAIRHILTTDDHAVLAAGTASGKTEAAFLPVLSAIADEPRGSIRAIYVGPLKALINDQFTRVEELCSHLDVPVYRWHGDVGNAEKKRLVKEPGGVLLITPESLESLFINRSNALARLFGGIRFVVIDELHAFLSNERGRHLRSLLYRVADRAERPPRIIGLSATIGEPRHAIEYVDRDHPQRVKWIEGDAGEPEIKFKLHAYVDDEPSDATEDARQAALEARDDAVANDLVQHCRGHANLVFANSRNDVELFGDKCNTLASERGLADRFMVHHGSLAADIRLDAEEAMKAASRNNTPATTFCSSTLEMGIDIGNVQMVGQIGAPWSVASLKQRLGRSGRRAGAARVMRMYVRCDRTHELSTLYDQLHLDLIRAIAVIELMVRDKWVEPAEPSAFDLSTLTQQIISRIAETGGCTVAVIYDQLCTRGVFRDVDVPTFKSLLRSLAGHDIVEQTSQGDLILGLVGERLRKDKSFYAAFQSADGYVVRNAAERIGTVDDAPLPEQHLILAGRRWRVTDVDEETKTIYVVPATGRKPAPFGNGGGDLHDRIVAKMRHVLSTGDDYGYLNTTALQTLATARDVAVKSHLCTQSLIALSPKRTVLMSWLGGRASATVGAALTATGTPARFDSHVPILIEIERPIAECETAIKRLIADTALPTGTLECLDPPPSAKYDHWLSADLVAQIKNRCWIDQDAIRKLRDTRTSFNHG